MRKIYLYQLPGRSAPLMEFMDALEPKARKKLEFTLLFLALALCPSGSPQ